MITRKRMLVLAALIAVVAGGIYLFARPDDRYLINARFDDAGGLRAGANVRIGGVPVGKVVNLEIGKGDVVEAELRVENSVAPIGRDARATVQVDGVFGERYVDLNPGNPQRGAPSGTTIPVSRTAESVRLDDVLDAVDVPTQEALRIFLNEQGTALVGRGRDLGALLDAMAPSLDATGQMISDFAQDNRALGRLVEESDRVLRSVAREREGLGRLVASAGGALDVLASRRRDLGETVRRAPATLESAQRALIALDGAAGPLAPAARGLRITAPRLATTLEELPRFNEAAIPTLRTAQRVAPRLTELGRRGAPVVRRLRPLARDLTNYSRPAVPFFRVLDDAAPALIGVLEGWARSTQPIDGASHVFRFGASSSSDTFAGILGDFTPLSSVDGVRPKQGGGSSGSHPPEGSHDGSAGAGPQPELPGLDDPDRLPQANLSQPPASGAQAGGEAPLLDFLLGP